MKVWTITTIIETENDWVVDDVRKELDQQFNCGDGAYMDVSKKVLKIKMIEKNDL